MSADGEVKLYEACAAAGITLLSIAHRPSLKRFHQLVVHVDGTVSATGKGWWMEELAPLTPAGQATGTGSRASVAEAAAAAEHAAAIQLNAITNSAQRPG